MEDDYQTNFNVKLTVDAAHGLLANDHGPPTTKVSLAPGDTDTESLFGATVAVKADGSFTYTPDPDPLNAFSGLDEFGYVIKDDNKDDLPSSETAYINVVPVVRDDVYVMSAESPEPLIVGAPGVLGNDGGIDPLSVSMPTEAQHGTISGGIYGQFVYSPLPGFHGTDTFEYTGLDLAGDPDPIYRGTVTIYVDGTPPVATMAPLAPVTLSTKVPVAWSATDDTSGPLTYDLQYRVAPWNGNFGPWTALLTGTTKRNDVVAGTYGRTFCFRVRAKDAVGHLSAFTPQRCTSTPLRARSLTYSSLWKRVPNGAYFSGEAETTVYHAQTAALRGVQAQRLYLVATKCPTCGTVRFRWNNVIIADVNLASPRAVHHVVIPIRTFLSPQLGTVALAVTSPNAKGVIIEGFAALRA